MSPSRVIGDPREDPNVGRGRPKDRLNHARAQSDVVAPRLTHFGSPVRVIGETGDAALTGVTAVAATDLITKAGHGYSAGDRVVFSALTGGAGIVPGTRYFVRTTGLTTNDFTISLTGAGGAVVDITTDMTAGTVQRMRPRYSNTQPGDIPVPGPRQIQGTIDTAARETNP